MGHFIVRGLFTQVKSPMNFHGGFYPSGNTLDYKMTHWLFTLFQIISNILTSSLLTFSVIYTFYFYIASEGLKIYQKYLIKKVPDFPFLEKSIWDNLNDYFRNSFLEGLSNFSLLLLLFDSSNLVSRATWRNELNQVTRHSPHLACRAWKVELFTICLKQLPHGLFL